LTFLHEIVVLTERHLAWSPEKDKKKM